MLRVVLRPELFSAGTDELRLLALFDVSRDGRHVLLTTPAFDRESPGTVQEWLSSLPQATKAMVQRVLEEGVSQNTNLSSTVATIFVGSFDHTDWRRGKIRLEHAVRLLSCPLKVLLENRRNDFQFLRRLAPQEHRKALDAAISAGWVEPEQAGGLSELRLRLEELATAPEHDVSAQIARLRVWVLFDRDANGADPRLPSDESDAVARVCQEPALSSPWPFGWHRLHRRSIENYLPEKVLEYAAVSATGHYQERVGRRVAARTRLWKERADAYFQLDMKQGFRSAAKQNPNAQIKLRRGESVLERVRRKKKRQPPVQDSDLPELFSGLPREVRALLSDGFGKDIAHLFGHSQVEERYWDGWFETEYRKGPAGQPARAEVIISLFERV